MSRIARADFEALARLAALDVGDGALHALERDLARILDYVAQLQAADADPADAAPAVPPHMQALRPDTVRPADPSMPLDRLAPERRDGFILMPAIGRPEPA